MSTGNSVESTGRISKDINVIKSDDMPKFFTLQGGMQDYRHFVSKNGIKESNRLLLALNDLVASKRLAKRAKLVEDAMKTEIFNLAFMRDAGRFFAFHNASSLLDGLELENFSSISTKLSLSYTLAGLTEKYQFDMNFDTSSILPKRICVLIGRNGIGKSQALHTIVNSLVKGEQKFYDRELGRPMISRLLAIATPGETANTFPPERVNKRIKYRRLILNRSARAKLSRRFCDLCIQLVRSDELIGDNNRWELFKETVKFFPNIKNIVIPLNENTTVVANHIIRIKDKFYVPLLKLNDGGEQAKLETQGNVSNADPMVYIDGDVFPLSSGQLAFIKFVIQACLFIENGTLVLLDEPETHLHPNFITEFIRILDQLLKLSGSIAIIATHSAYFVREIPRKQVLVFKEDSSGHVNIQNPRLKTFGADVGAISYFVFEDEVTNVLVENILEHFPKDSDEQIKLLHELKDELSSDLMMYICRKLDIKWQD